MRVIIHTKSVLQNCSHLRFNHASRQAALKRWECQTRYRGIRSHIARNSSFSQSCLRKVLVFSVMNIKWLTGKSLRWNQQIKEGVVILCPVICCHVTWGSTSLSVPKLLYLMNGNNSAPFFISWNYTGSTMTITLGSHHQRWFGIWLINQNPYFAKTVFILLHAVSQDSNSDFVNHKLWYFVNSHPDPNLSAYIFIYK